MMCEIESRSLSEHPKRHVEQKMVVEKLSTIPSG
jgi:hypothetical protein